MTKHQHQSHPDIIKRLNRAAGHLKSVTQMLVDERSCLEVAQQLQAVEKAIQQAKRTLVLDHMDHCLDDRLSVDSDHQRADLDEFKAIARYL